MSTDPPPKEIITSQESPRDSEKGVNTAEVREDFREYDFLTRNGLNIESFKRRKQTSYATYRLSFAHHKG